jgi:hypothetical protein
MNVVAVTKSTKPTPPIDASRPRVIETAVFGLG